MSLFLENSLENRLENVHISYLSYLIFLFINNIFLLEKPDSILYFSFEEVLNYEFSFFFQWL